MGYVITRYPNVILDSRVRCIISKGPKYSFPSNIDFTKCRREIVASLNEFSNRWCKRGNCELDAEYKVPTLYWLPKLHKPPKKQDLLLGLVLVRPQNFLNCYIHVL